MSLPRRSVLTLGATLVIVAASAMPASAAKPSQPPQPKAPTFRVSLPADALSGDDRRTPLAFQFTQTSNKGAPGLLRLTIPNQDAVTEVGTTVKVGWGQLQTTHESEEGYLRVDNETCTAAALKSFNGSAIQEPHAIEVAFQCDPGQQFTVAFFPRSTYWNTDRDYSPDQWSFPIETRYRTRDPWTAQPSKTLEVQVHPLTITLPSVNIVPPQTVIPNTIVPEYDPSNGEVVQIFFGAPAQITDLHWGQVQMTLGEPQALDSGRGLVLVNPQNLLGDHPVELVVSGLPGSYFSEVRMFPPVDTFSYKVRLPGESQYVLPTLPMTFVVLDGNPTSTIRDPQEGIRCQQARGVFSKPLDAQWQCLVPDAHLTQAQAVALQSEFNASYAYCSTKNVSLVSIIGTENFWLYRCHHA